MQHPILPIHESIQYNPPGFRLISLQKALPWHFFFTSLGLCPRQEGFNSLCCMEDADRDFIRKKDAQKFGW